MAGMLALMMGCVWVIAATWDGPNRMLAVGALCIGFVLVTIIGVSYAAGGGSRASFEGLRAEWRSDLEEIARLDPTLVGQPPRAIMGGNGGRHQ